MTPAEIERIKDLLPTTLGSDEVREQIAADILRRSVFSARMASAPYLAKVREVCAAISAGDTNWADARNALEAVLEQMGHSMQDGGGLKNPASIRRINLILETQTQMAASVAQLMEQTEGVVYQWPAWELARVESRVEPRLDWPARWRAAGDSVGWEGALQGRFVALKSSPIWQALGDGEGGFNDKLRNPYPPFAYSSGMGWLDVDRETCARYGLDLQSSSSKLQAPGSELQPPSLSPGEQDIVDAIRRYGMPELAEGLL